MVNNNQGIKTNQNNTPASNLSNNQNAIGPSLNNTTRANNNTGPSLNNTPRANNNNTGPIGNNLNKNNNNNRVNKNTRRNINTNTNTNNNLNSGPSFLERTKDKFSELTDNENLVQIFQLILIAIVTFLIMYGIRWFIKSQQNKRMESPFIIRGSNSGKSSLVVSQDPAEDNSITLYRSDGEEGAEFTYTTWLLIQNLEYKAGEWKHIFHKGNKTSYPNRAPGVWIHPNNNALRIYMNTYDDPLEFTDIDNIPVKKWFHISISLNHKYLDIYFNGQLRKRKELTSLPRQNYGELWCCLFGGFEGYISKLQYHRKALDYTEIEDIVKAGPSKDACGDTGEYPPYLDDNWWYDL